MTKDDLSKYANNEEELGKLNKFYDITKGLIKFSKGVKVKELLSMIEQ